MKQTKSQFLDYKFAKINSLEKQIEGLVKQQEGVITDPDFANNGVESINKLKALAISIRPLKEECEKVSRLKWKK